MQGKTTTGFEWKISENAIDNMELLDAISETAEGNPLAISKALTLLLGTDQKKRLYDFYRREDGSVPTEAVSQAFIDILQSQDDLKKS